MKRLNKRVLILPVIALLLFSMLLTSCNSNNKAEEGTTAGGTQPPAGTPEGEIEYKVNVIDYLGKPMNDIVVSLLKDGAQEKMKVAKEGLASFTAAKGNYTVSISAPGGDYYYDASKCVLSEAAPEITVQLYLKTSKKASEELYAISHITDDVEKYTAYQVSEGGTYVELTAGDMSYFVFRPSREGVYKITFVSDADIEIGYYGSPLTVATSKVSRTEIVNNAFEIEVRKINLGQTLETTTPYVIGLKPASAETKGCVLTVEWIKTPDFSPIDVAWQTVRPTEADLKKITDYFATTSIADTAVFKNLDVTDENLTVVYNETDGFYHYNTADGPVVYLRIGTKSPYLDDLMTVCETGQLGAYFYDAEGKFLRKESYNELISDYAGVSNERDKVCPLNKQLAEVLKNAGENKGWWKTGTALYLFGNELIPTDTAWLFACGYYE